jgi:hypothetical protein
MTNKSLDILRSDSEISPSSQGRRKIAMDVLTMGRGLTSPKRHRAHTLPATRSEDNPHSVFAPHRGLRYSESDAEEHPMTDAVRRRCGVLVAVLLILTWVSATTPQDGKTRKVIIPFDAAVATLSVDALQNFTTEISEAGLQATLLQAALLFDALGASGVRYSGMAGPRVDGRSPLLDGVRPFRDPGETLRDRSGNDEDLAVLYASALLSSGLRTALIVSAGPLLVAFDTEVDAQAARRIFPTSEYYLKKDGSIWLPVDVTQLGDRFINAWDSARRLPKRLLIEIQRGEVPDTSVAGNGHVAQRLDMDLVQTWFRSDLEATARLFRAARLGHRSKHQKVTFFLRLSALQADVGRFDRAHASLDSATAAGADRRTVLFQRANLFDRQGRYREMAKIGGLLTTLDPRNPRGYLVSAYAALQLKEIDRAKEFFRKAKALSASEAK